MSPKLPLAALAFIIAASGQNKDTPSSPLPLDGLYLHIVYRMGVGGAVYPAYQPYVMFNDGAVTSDLTYYPQSPSDISQWRAREPRAWGRWTKTGTAINIRWDDPARKPETWEKWFKARPGPPDMALQGRFQSVGGSGNTALGGDAMVVAWDRFEFSPGGEVITTGGGGASTSRVASGSQRAEQQARYRVDGYSIEFQFPGARPERRWFYRYPDSDRVIGIGNGTYSLRK